MIRHGVGQIGIEATFDQFQRDLTENFSAVAKAISQIHFYNNNEENKKETNCHNCGAPLKRYKNRCEYCGTEY